MARTRPFVLPATLRALLEAARDALATGRITMGLLIDLASELQALPPDAVGPAGQAIRITADLSIRAGQGTPGAPGRARSHLALLDAWPGLAPLFLFHGDGHLREAALGRLRTGLTSSFLVAAVAFRLNDWVPQVRAAARGCAERVIALSDADTLAAAAPFLLDRRPQWTRGREEVTVLDGLLERDDVADRVAAHLLAAPTGPLARQLRQMLRQPALDRHLPRLAGEALQPAVRAVAISTLLEGRASWPDGWEQQWIDKRYGVSRAVTLFGFRPVASPLPPDVVLGAAAADRSAAVRRVAAIALIRDRSRFGNATAMIDTLAADPSPPVRERARFLLEHPEAGLPGASR